MLAAAVRTNAIAAILDRAGRIGELVGIDGVEGFFSETGWYGFGSLNEAQRRRMGSKERFDWRWLGSVGTACTRRMEEFDELFRGAARKAVNRVSNNIGVHMLGKMEPNPNTARTRVRIVVGNVRNTSEIGKANRHRRRRPVKMRGAREGTGVGPGREDSGEEDTFRVGGAVTGMQSNEIVEGLERIMAEGN